MASANVNQLEMPSLTKTQKLSHIFSSKLVAKAPVFEELEDITFIVGNKETGIEHIGGNRTIFAVQSDVFQAQLFGKMQEGKKDKIIVEDVTPAAFTFLKHLFYVKEQQLTVDIVLDVLYASKKYLLLELECECYKFIETVKNLDDWWKLISKQTITTDVDMDDALIRKSQVLIKNSNKIVKDVKKLAQLTPGWLAKLVQSSSLVINSEEIIWEMCIQYCEDNIISCKTGMYIDEKCDYNQAFMAKMMNKYFVKHIRFALMDRNYFFNKIEKSGILDDKTMYNICKCCLFDDPKNRVNKYNSRYLWHPRKPYDQLFLARYEIRMLSAGDQIVAQHSNGSYKMLEIDQVDWASDQHHSLGKNGIIFATLLTEHYYQFCTVDSLCRERQFASTDPYNGNINHNSIVQPTQHDIQCFYRNKMTVEYREYPAREWITGKIVKINQRYDNQFDYGWCIISVCPIVDGQVKRTEPRYFHPWNFSLLRPS